MDKMDKTTKMSRVHRVEISRITFSKLYAAKANYIKISKLPLEKKDPSWDEIISWGLDALLNAQENARIGLKIKDQQAEV